MSGLYNIVFGNQPHSGSLLQLLQQHVAPDTDFEVGRFRDAWLERWGDGDLRVRVYTRNGGGNRPDYQVAIASMRAHPWFRDDRDDNFDSTYASFWFQVPSAMAGGLEQIAVEPIDTDARWQEAIRQVEAGEVEPPKEIVEMLDRVLRNLD